MASLRRLLAGVASHGAPYTASPARAALLVTRVPWQPRLPASLRPLQSSASFPIDEGAQPVEPSPITLPPIPDVPTGWRHDVFGFSADALPHIIRISLPSNAGEEDVRTLLKKNKITVKSSWIHFRRANPRRHYGYCLLEIPDQTHKERLLTLLPSWRLVGKELTIQTEWLKDLVTKNIVSSMARGWYANESSDISKCRYLEPHTRGPGYISKAKLEGRIVRVGNLPSCTASGGHRKSILQRFYELLHNYHVEGIDFHVRKRELRLPSGRYTGDHAYIMFSKGDIAETACYLLHQNLILGHKPMTMVLNQRYVIPDLHFSVEPMDPKKEREAIGNPGLA